MTEIENSIEKVIGEESRFLTFFIGEEMFGIPIQFVTEIVGMQKINSLPDVPNYIKGLINLRGKIIPVVDMSNKLTGVDIVVNDRTCIIVVENELFSIGLMVDRVSEVLDISKENISETANLHINLSSNAIFGLGKVSDKIVLLIDVNELFSDSETENIEGIF